MLPVILALLVQSFTISGTLISPRGSAQAGAAQVVLLPSEYAQMFNAEAQLRIDQYWNFYKPEFAEKKETFSKAFALAYEEALDIVLSRMRIGGKVDSGSLIRSATGGSFEFRGIPPGDYKIVATASIQGTTYMWTEALRVTSSPIFVQMKTRVP
jgi:hypothetical protein